MSVNTPALPNCEDRFMRARTGSSSRKVHTIREVDGQRYIARCGKVEVSPLTTFDPPANRATVCRTCVTTISGRPRPDVRTSTL